jgi:hypothetical protein
VGGNTRDGSTPFSRTGDEAPQSLMSSGLRGFVVSGLPRFPPKFALRNWPQKVRRSSRSEPARVAAASRILRLARMSVRARTRRIPAWTSRAKQTPTEAAAHHQWYRTAKATPAIRTGGTSEKRKVTSAVFRSIVDSRRSSSAISLSLRTLRTAAGSMKPAVKARASRSPGTKRARSLEKDPTRSATVLTAIPTPTLPTAWASSFASLWPSFGTPNQKPAATNHMYPTTRSFRASRAARD